MSHRTLGVILTCCFVLHLGCSAPAIQLMPPFPGRLEVGDAVRITTRDDIVVQGRVLSLDAYGVTLRTGRRTAKAYPYEVQAFTEKVVWQNIETVVARAVLDARGRLITEQEIQENMLWRDRLRWTLSGVLLGTGAGLYAGPDETVEVDSEAFWGKPAIGAMAGGVLGYLVGRRLDRARAVRRIEYAQEMEAEAPR